jgi:hypothetical protein
MLYYEKENISNRKETEKRKRKKEKTVPKANGPTRPGRWGVQRPARAD